MLSPVLAAVNLKYEPWEIQPERPATYCFAYGHEEDGNRWYICATELRKLFSVPEDATAIQFEVSKTKKKDHHPFHLQPTPENLSGGGLVVFPDGGDHYIVGQTFKLMMKLIGCRRTCMHSDTHYVKVYYWQ